MSFRTSDPGPRKILMTADTVGGVWTYALDLVRSLAPHGVEVVLATMGTPVSREQRTQVAALPNVELTESRCKLEWMDDPWPDVDRAGDWLLDLAAEFHPDMIHLNGYSHGALPWNAPVLIVAHSCVCSWWSGVKAGEAPRRYNEYRRRVRKGLAAADCIVAPTAAMLDSLTGNYGALPRSCVISNACDPARFSPAAKRPRIMTAGRIWDEAKNVTALDKAAPRVRWPIHVAGTCEHPDGTRAAFENVRCLGRLTSGRMAERLAASAIYALPARYEPFGLSALEAGLSGCALVLGDIASLREVWGDAAIFVRPDDAEALARALNGLIDNGARRAEMGRRARIRALHFSPRKMAEEYLAVYRACMAQPAEAAA